MPKPQQPADKVVTWLRANGLPVGALTGTDTRALRAGVQILEHYAYDRDDFVLQAFANVVSRMQPQTQEMAYHSIAMVLDWSDRHRLWLTAKSLAHCQVAYKMRQFKLDEVHRCTFE